LLKSEGKYDKDLERMRYMIQHPDAAVEKTFLALNKNLNDLEIHIGAIKKRLEEAPRRLEYYKQDYDRMKKYLDETFEHED